MPRTRSLIALLAGCVAADESATNVRRALALSGLLDDATCSAAFVGARWVDTSGESPLSRGELGAYFGAGLTVTSFEADDEECARQEAAIAARPAEARVAAERCVAAVLADKPAADAVPFYVTKAPVCSSLLRPNRRAMRVVGLDSPDFRCASVVRTRRVATKPLDDVLARGAVDFARLDVQGADLAVLRGGEHALRDALAVQIEVEFVELYEGQPLFAEVDAYLRGLGFTFMSFVDESRQPRRRDRSLAQFGASESVQLIHADAVYLRLDIVPLDDDADVDDEEQSESATISLPHDAARETKLVRLAAVAGALGYYSVTVEALDALQRWTAASLCGRARAAVALRLLVGRAHAAARGVPNATAYGRAYDDALRLAHALYRDVSGGADAADEGSMLRALVSACRAPIEGDAVEATIMVAHTVLMEGSWKIEVALRRGEAPRTRAAEFCRHHMDGGDTCIGSVAAYLEAARDLGVA